MMMMGKKADQQKSNLNAEEKSPLVDFCESTFKTESEEKCRLLEEAKTEMTDLKAHLSTNIYPRSARYPQ